MTIAAIDQSLIIARVDRINRFTKGVQALHERIMGLIDDPSRSTPVSEEYTAQTEATFEKPEVPDIAMQQQIESFKSSAQPNQDEVEQKLTPDEMDLDAIISSIKIDDSSLQP